MAKDYSYGYCPTCGGIVTMRERRINGDDICENGHRYPSSQSQKTPKKKSVTSDTKRKQTLHLNKFIQGVFAAMEYLVLARGEDSLAKELADQNGIDQELALKLSKQSGYDVRKMSLFIRRELRK